MMLFVPKRPYSPFLLACSVVLAALLLMPTSATAQQSSDDSAAVDTEPHASRLLFSSTARPIGDGQVYASLSSIVVPQLGYGVTDNLSVEVGGQFIPQLYPKLLYLDPTVTLWTRDNIHIAAASRLSMVKGRRHYIGGRSISITSEDRLSVVEENWEAHWEPEVLATVVGSRGALTGGVGVHVATVDETLDQSYVRGVYLQAGLELQLLSWMRFISESEIHGGYTDRFIGRESNSSGGFDIRVTESTGAYLQSANALRLHGDHFATEIGIGVQALTDPVLSSDDTSLFGIVRFTYQF